MIKNISKLYLTFVFAVVFSLTVFAQRIGEPHEKWLMLSTPHFEIFYSAEHQDLSLYYARIAEISYAEITTIFTSPPAEKIVVIINDATDAPNGFATLIPYPYIMVYPVQAGRDDVLSESAEWAKELFVHELTHIFQLYPAEGYFKLIKPVFGTIVAPNLLMPLWWKEGMAVEIESRFSHQGRIRSYFQDASLRALVLENKLFNYTLAEANEILPSWPYGGRPYLLGSLLMGNIGTQNDGKSLNDLTLAQAAQLPYFVEDAHRGIFGFDYESHYLLTLDTYSRHAEQQLLNLRTVSSTETVPIDSKLISSRHPRFNYDGQILGLFSVEKNSKKIAFYKFSSEANTWEKQKFKKAPSGDISTFEFHPTQNKIIFAKIDQVNAQKNYSDLYLFDLTEDKETKLTKSARVRNPIWNAEGSIIYFISTFNGKTQLKSFNVSTEAIEQLLELGHSERIHEISLYTNNELFVGIKDIKGVIQTKLFNISDRNLNDLKFSVPEAEHVKNRHGKIYFTSIANGVSNIYEHTNSKEIPVTHFLTGALDFDIGVSQTAVATLHTASGFQVHSFEVKPFKQLPQISNAFRDRYKYEEKEAPAFESRTEEAPALKYLYPHYWIPFISTSSANNGVFYQLVTSGQDPLLIHRYNLAIDYDSFIKKVGYNFDYINSAFNWPLTLGAERTFKPIGTTNVFIDRSLFTLGFIPDTFNISPKFSINAGLQVSEVEQLNTKTKHVGPYVQMVYKNIQQTLFNIYPTGGGAVFLKVENQKAQDPTSDFLGDYDQAIGSLMGYNSRWLPEDHSMYGKISFLHTLQKVSTRFGTSNLAFPAISDSPIPDFLLRGYGAGQFFGTRMVSLNTEYRFPITKVGMGSGTYPYYVKELNGAVIVDGLTVTGGAFDKNDVLKAEKMSQSFWSTGLEARLETTLGYLLPVNFIFGYYQPLSPQYAEQGAFGLSLQIGSGFPN